MSGDFSLLRFCTRIDLVERFSGSRSDRDPSARHEIVDFLRAGLDRYGANFQISRYDGQPPRGSGGRFRHDPSAEY